MNPIEVSLYHAIALDPALSMMLMSPSGGRLREWVSGDLARKLFTSIANLASNGKTVNPLGIISSGKFEPDEVKYVMKEWQEGKKSSPADFNLLLETLRDDHVVKESKNVVSEFLKQIDESPANVVNIIGKMQSMMSTLAQYGVKYDPDPTSHYNDKSSAAVGTWGNKLFDAMYDGGIPSRGYSLTIGPSGMGKSSLSRSQAAYLISQQLPVLIATNEDLIDAGETSRRLRKALITIFAGERSDEDIDKDIKTYCQVYDLRAGANDITNIKQWMRWFQPTVTIVDSLDNMNYPPECAKMKDDQEKHRTRANYFASMTDNGFVSIVGNGSKAEQTEIIRDISKVNTVMAFGSVWYHNISSYSYVFRRDSVDTRFAQVKRCKNRGETGMIGNMYDMEYNSEGGYYHDQATPKVEMF